MEPESPPLGESGIAAGPPTAEGSGSSPVPPPPSEFPPLDSPAEPLLPPCLLPVEVPPDATLPPEEPLEVDPVAEPPAAAVQSSMEDAASARPTEFGSPPPAIEPSGGAHPPATEARPPEMHPHEVAPTAPVAAQRAAQRASRKREYPSLLKHYRRLLNLLLLVFLGVGATGWTYRWYVLREALLQFKKAHLSNRAARDMYPLLCETLLHDRSSDRRLRAANLLGPRGYPPVAHRDATVWNTLLDATMDPDRKVEEAAWQNLSFGHLSGDNDHRLVPWFAGLPVSRCVEVLSRTKSPLVRKEFLVVLKALNGATYWITARWALRSLDDPEAVNVVLERTRRDLYVSPTVEIRANAAPMTACLLAGLENKNTRIRDRCRRLLLDYARHAVPPEDLLEWIRSTRDISTTVAIVQVVKRIYTLDWDWESPLRSRFAQETDFEAAVELSLALGELVGEERDAEFLRAGLENPDPKIREYFETLLTAPPVEEEAPVVEPEDGR